MNERLSIEQWKLEERMKYLENECENITRLNEVLQIMFNDYRLQMGIVEGAYRLQIHRFGPTTYKHYNTISFLIGIAPQGSIIFISQGWRGWTLGVHLTKNARLSSKLLPGDVILADRGFTIQEAYYAEV